MSATPDSTLADPQQVIIDLQQQLAEVQQLLNQRTVERDEGLQRETATAEVMQVINSSPGDLSPVFDALLEKAHSLCDAPLGSLVLCDGDQLRAVATRGYPQEYEAMARRGFSPIPPFRRLLSGEPFVKTDAATGLPSDEDDPMRRAAVEIAGIRTALFVPLRKDSSVLGYISAQRQEVRPFTDKHIVLLQNFAAQAVIAMENARLITETREALEQQTATAEVLQVINSSPGDLAPVFEAILEKAHALCGIALGELELYEDGKVRAVAMRGVFGLFADLLRQPFAPPPGSPPARLIAGESTVQITDVSELARNRPDDPRAQAGAQHGLRTALFVPLRKDNTLLGYITGYRREARLFSEKEIALLQNFAAQAVIAMENTRLITETREALEQQTATAEVLQVINSSPGDLAPVFDAMLAKAMDLCGAAFGFLTTYDGQRFTPAAMRGVPQPLAESRREWISPIRVMLTLVFWRARTSSTSWTRWTRTRTARATHCGARSSISAEAAPLSLSPCARTASFSASLSSTARKSGRSRTSRLR
jgi:GAF domain-containing protein